MTCNATGDRSDGAVRACACVGGEGKGAGASWSGWEYMGVHAYGAVAMARDKVQWCGWTRTIMSSKTSEGGLLFANGLPPLEYRPVLVLASVPSAESLGLVLMLRPVLCLALISTPNRNIV